MSVTSKLRAAKQGVSHANTGSGVKDSIGAETKPKESKTVTAMTPPGFAELQAALGQQREAPQCANLWTERK